MPVHSNWMMIVELVIKLYKEGHFWFNDLRASDWRRLDLVKVLAECGRALFTGADDVRNILNLHGRRAIGRPGKAVILKTEEDMLFLLEPVIGERADKQGLKTTFYLGVVTRVESDHKFFGYRYEGPEGGVTHNLYHAQPIRAFEKDTSIGYSIAWYPGKWPTFPLNVRDDCQLLLSLIFSFQGIEKVRQETISEFPKIRESALNLLKRFDPGPIASS